MYMDFSNVQCDSGQVNCQGFMGGGGGVCGGGPGGTSPQMYVCVRECMPELLQIVMSGMHCQ